MMKACFLLPSNRQSRRKYIITQSYKLIYDMGLELIACILLTRARGGNDVICISDFIQDIVTLYTSVMPDQINFITIIQFLIRI